MVATLSEASVRSHACVVAYLLEDLNRFTIPIILILILHICWPYPARTLDFLQLADLLVHGLVTLRNDILLASPKVEWTDQEPVDAVCVKQVHEPGPFQDSTI